jgi:hypothetical protein
MSFASLFGPLSIASAVLLIAMLAAPNASAQRGGDRTGPDPAVAVERAIASIDRTAERATTRIKGIETQTLERIASLDETTSPERIGKVGIRAVVRIGSSAVRQIQCQSSRLALRLEQAEADPALLDELRSAADDAIEAVKAEARSAARAIADAAGLPHEAAAD